MDKGWTAESVRTVPMHLDLELPDWLFRLMEPVPPDTNLMWYVVPAMLLIAAVVFYAEWHL